jgi:hypothetical protein
MVPPVKSPIRNNIARDQDTVSRQTDEDPLSADPSYPSNFDRFAADDFDARPRIVRR